MKTITVLGFAFSCEAQPHTLPVVYDKYRTSIRPPYYPHEPFRVESAVDSKNAYIIDANGLAWIVSNGILQPESSGVNFFTYVLKMDPWAPIDSILEQLSNAYDKT